LDVLSADWVLPVSGPPIPDGAVAIENGRLTAVGTQAELGRGRAFSNAAILPGLVNAHSHLEYAVYAGFGDGTSDFAEWIGIHVERKLRLQYGDVLDIARLGAAECLASGVTTVGDCAFSGAAAPACAELGLRAIVYLEVFGSDPDAALARFEELRAVASPAESERVALGVSPHAPYTVSRDVYEACDRLRLPVATHLAESASEEEYLAGRGGAWAGFADLLVPPAGTSGIRMLAEGGILGSHVIAAHCVTVDAEEIALLAGRGVGVAHCPRSNAQLGCGVAPLRALLDAGVTVGIGTDSPASTPSFDMFDEVRTAVASARARERHPDALTAAEALELATIGGARALGMGDEIGSLEPGKLADLIVVDMEGSPFLPWEDPSAAIVLGGSPSRVLLTLVGGEVRYESGTFPWHELRQNGTRARAKLLGL
jgi:cytosine/adenosine deaminase-related metal-dependent hydrolase